MAMENMNKVIDNKIAPANTEIDVVTTNAVLEDKEAVEHVEEVKDELNKRAEEIKTEDPAAPEVKVKNIYTKLKLEESVSDFDVKSLADDSDEDDYLDYDMFDFAYGLVTDDWPRPKNILGRRIRKFQHTDSDDYIKTNEPTGMSQVGTDMVGNVVVYSNDPDAFDDVKQMCDYYHLTYSNVRPSSNKNSHWAYNFTINVPMTGAGYPVMAEDFFAQFGWTLEDVIESNKTGGGKSANWGTTYAKRAEKDRSQTSTYVNDRAVDAVYDKYVRLASTNGDMPLDGFINDMLTELKGKNLKYSAAKLKKKFLDEFNDDFEDDIEEGLLSTVSGVLNNTLHTNIF